MSGVREGNGGPAGAAREEASRFNALGSEHADNGRVEDAIAAYRAAIETDPTWSIPWYNLGLRAKYAGDWEASRAANRRAATLDPDDGDAWWNLGIAATALALWDEAREAWSGCGIELPEGEGPVDMGLGLTPVRLAPEGAAEVVWCDRLDPARALVRNVPFPASGRRYGDLVLHDGAVVGHRRIGDREIGVFNELELLEASEFRTFEVFLEGVTAETLEALEGPTEDLGAAMENWSRSVRYLCRQCSEGRPHEAHDDARRADVPGLGVGVAARDDAHLARVLANWAGALGGDRVAGWSAPSIPDRR